LGHHIGIGLLAAGVCAPALAQAIFTCVDAKGRRITADRPIVECLDREQKELSPTGIVKRKIGPSLTAEERAAEEVKQREEIEERNRLAEEKKRERALLTRYPDKQTHDRERAAALAAVDEATKIADEVTRKLIEQRRRLDTELEFYQGDVKKTPADLRRKIEENRQHMESQERFIANQDSEKRRINQRFDDEQAQLKPLWAQMATSATPAPAPARKKKP